MDNDTRDQQLLFNRTLEHIRKQKFPSTDSAGEACRYRGARDRKCGAGIFITDYDPEMEGLGWKDVKDQYRDNIETLADYHYRFVLELQWAHDEAAHNERAYQDWDFLPTFEENMAMIANHSGLDYTPPEVKG